MKKPKGIWTVQEFKEGLEDQVKKGFLPLPPKNPLSASWIFKAYQEVENKQAKNALLIQLAEVLVVLRLRNPTKRFDKVISEIGIEKTFAYELLTAYTNPKEKWEYKHG